MSIQTQWDNVEEAHDEALRQQAFRHLSINSYKPEVIADSSGQWTGNALRFEIVKPADAERLAWIFRRIDGEEKGRA